MRDTNQLELNFSGEDAPLSMAEQDKEVHLRLERCQVLTYANSIQRGHRAWADRHPPSSRAIRTALQYFRENPEAYGAHYVPALEDVLRESTAGEVEDIRFYIVTHDLYAEEVRHMIIPQYQKVT